MSRIYNVPPDMNEKEKMIGGILDLTQGFWIIGGLMLGAIIFILIFVTINGQLAVVLGGLFCLSGVPFALYKKNNLTLYQYLSLKRKFNKKEKHLINIHKEEAI